MHISLMTMMMWVWIVGKWLKYTYTIPLVKSINFKYLKKPTFELPHDLVWPHSFTINDDRKLHVENSIVDLDNPCLLSPRMDFNLHSRPHVYEIIAYFGEKGGGFIRIYCMVEKQSVSSLMSNSRSRF